jgi:hypothetical protein
MKFRPLGFCLLFPVASFAIACGANSDANKANLDMSAPAHENMSPSAGDGGAVDNATKDLSKPATVNESPAPGGAAH